VFRPCNIMKEKINAGLHSKRLGRRETIK